MNCHPQHRLPHLNTNRSFTKKKRRVELGVFPSTEPCSQGKCSLSSPSPRALPGPGTPVNGALAAPGLERRLATRLCQTPWRSQTSAEMQGDPGMGLPSREGAPRTCAGRGTDKCKGPEVGACLRSRKAERQEGSGRAEVGGVGGPTRGAHRLRCSGHGM